MAFRFLNLTWAASLALAAVAGAADTPGLTYRNGVILAVDPVRRILSVELPDGATQLAAGEDVDVAALRPGEAVLVGVREMGGRAEAVRVRTAVASEMGRSLATSVLPDSDRTPPLGPRRPLYVIPDRPAGSPPGGGRSVITEKTPALTIMEAPEEPAVPEAEAAPPEPSRVARLREETERELAAALHTVDILAGTADRTWDRYQAAGCPPLGTEGPRPWLKLPASASAPPGTCTELLEAANASARLVRERVSSIEDRARAGWVPPGVLRRMLAAHGLE